MQPSRFTIDTAGASRLSRRSWLALLVALAVIAVGAVVSTARAGDTVQAHGEAGPDQLDGAGRFMSTDVTLYRSTGHVAGTTNIQNNHKGFGFTGAAIVKL